MRTAFRIAQTALVAATAARLLAGQEPARPVQATAASVLAQPAARSGTEQTLRSYEDAMRLAPRDPAPAWALARAGMRFGGEDGEAAARRGLQRVLELDPLHEQAWSQWVLVFRNTDSRRRMRERLARHDSLPEVRARIAWLYLEDEQYPQADSLLDALIALDSGNAEWLAWRAQSAFEAADTTRGMEFYLRALGAADRDTTGVLWRQAVGIARPAEIAAWDNVSLEQRGQWLAAFWARRSPNLFGHSAARLVEHFQRLRYARRTWPLQHPLVTWQPGLLTVALTLDPTPAEASFYRRCEVNGRQNAATASPPPIGFDTTVPVTASLLGMLAPLDLDVQEDSAALGRLALNLATGLDDRGLLYLRAGPPRDQETGGRNTFDPRCRTPDVEIWHYDGRGDVRFARLSFFEGGAGSGDMMFRAANAREARAVANGLGTDAPSEPAPLPFDVWTAQFAGPRRGATEVAVVSSRGALAATLAGPGSMSDTRRGPAGWVVIEADSGSGLTLLAHARDSARLGRRELPLRVRSFAGRSVSDMLVGTAWPGAPASRYDMLRHVARGRVVAEGATLRAYTELYGLVADEPTVRYTALYSLARTGDPDGLMARDEWVGAGATQLSFDRQVRASRGVPVREVLDLSPERLPPGRYVLRLDVLDANGNPAGRAQVSFLVR